MEGLLAKCAEHNFPDWLTVIKQQFLTGRSFQVQINNSLSRTGNIRAGVPQGSILGPMLFNIHMADLKITKPSNLALYADDAVIYMQHISERPIMKQTQDAIINAEKWYGKWKLKINPHQDESHVYIKNRRKTQDGKKTNSSRTTHRLGQHAQISWSDAG